MTTDPSGAPGEPPRGRRDVRRRAAERRRELRHQVEATRAQLDATNARIRERTGRDLVMAVLIGLVLGGAMLASLIVFKQAFVLFGGLLLVFASFELASALRGSGRRVPRLASLLATAAVVPAAYWLGESGAWFVFLGGLLFVTLWRLAEEAPRGRRTGPRALASDLAAGVFVQCYVTLLGAFALLLTARDDGQWWTLSFLVVVVAADTGAYASGLAFGKHPMAPSISPKKTWEGFAGAAAASLAAGVLLATLLLGLAWWFGVLFGLGILLTATIGDLAESILKRDLGVKDMSSWLPGHGGFLDRLDSILPSAVLAYAFFLAAGHAL